LIFPARRPKGGHLSCPALGASGRVSGKLEGRGRQSPLFLLIKKGNLLILLRHPLRGGIIGGTIFLISRHVKVRETDPHSNEKRNGREEDISTSNEGKEIRGNPFIFPFLT